MEPALGFRGAGHVARAASLTQGGANHGLSLSTPLNGKVDIQETEAPLDLENYFLDVLTGGGLNDLAVLLPITRRPCIDSEFVWIAKVLDEDLHVPLTFRLLVDDPFLVELDVKAFVRSDVAVVQNLKSHLILTGAMPSERN